MQPNHSHSYRRLARQAPLRSTTGPAVLSALIVVALVTACSSGSGSPGAQVGGAPSGGGTPCGGSGLGFESPCQVPATPPDVPTGAPSCTGSYSQQATVPADLQTLINVCYSQQDKEWQVTNLSQSVLDVTPTADYSSTLQVITYDSSSLQNVAGELEVEAQNAVMNNQSPDNSSLGEVLLPVGGMVIAAADDLPLTVGVDKDFSRRSYGATALTSYVVSNVLDVNPDTWSQAIANCVNDTYQLWQHLQQQPPPSVSTLLSDAFQAASSCNELRNKVKEYLESKGQQENLAAEDQRAEEHADEANWESEYMRVEQAHDEIRADL
jgi:hypothetical protein